jgi:gluconolactonase
MTSKSLLTMVACAVGSAAAYAQTQPPRVPATPYTPKSLQAPADPGYAEFTKMCKTPPPARGGGPARGGAAGGGRAGAPPAPPAGVRETTLAAIPGVIAAGQQWKFLWQEVGNNGDGILWAKDGLLLAQNDNSQVLKLTDNGKTSVAFRDTHTGGALSMSPKGALFMVQRGLRQNVTQLEPQRRIVADKYNGEPLDCVGGVINDLTADSKGGVYYTMGGVYYVSPSGTVTKYGENVTPNGIVLSADEKTLYVTNGPAMAAFDVQPDGSLTNQREFAKLTSGGGDGSTIDAAGRVYVTTQAGGIEVLGPDGKTLGNIPTPRPVITGAFGGKDKKTFYILARGATDANGTEVPNAAQVWSIQMQAQGYRGRAK